VSGNAGDVIYDVVTATGVDDDGDPVEGSDDAEVTLTDVPSSIDVVKTATPDNVDEPGGSVVYTVDVENTSPVDMVTIDSVIDDIYGNVCDAANPLIISTTCVLPQVLGVGDIYSFTFEAMVMGNANDVITDVVTASGVDDDGVPVSDSDDATVTINDITLARPIVVTKTADPIEVNAPGGDVTYTVTIENLSAVDTMFISSLIDDIYGDLNGKGDCSVPQTIPPLGSYTCSFIEPVSGSGGDVITDIVTASGFDDDGNPVSDFDDATVTIIGVFQGCTPGYWKQEHHFDSWKPTGYSPGNLVGDVFEEAPGDLAGDSLVDALHYPGGPGFSGAARILLRAGVAATLNAGHPDLNFEIADPGDVIDAVNKALASGKRGKMLGLAGKLDGYNNAGCFDDMEEEPEVQSTETSSPAPQAPGIKTTLGPAYPNPLNPDTWIPFRLAADANVKIEIYDVTGRLVRRLDLGYRPAGSYWDRSKAAYWDGRNEAGESVTSGIYFYKMTAGAFTAIKRMVILK
jgi:hypothetical protein